MHRFLKNIHKLFWVCAFLSLVYGVYIHIKLAESALDINIHDTVFVIGSIQAIIFQTVFFLIFGFAYYTFYNVERYNPVDWLSIAHIVLTLIGLSMLLFIPDFQPKLPIGSTEDIHTNLVGSRRDHNLKMAGVLAVFIAQPLFLINLFVAIFRK